MVISAMEKSREKGQSCVWVVVSILKRVIRKGLTEKVTFE